MAILDQIELPNGITYDFQDNQPAVLDIPNTPAPIATFSGASNLPLSSLKVAVTPYQDLHGYDAPWAGGAGKNKLKVTATTTTKDGVIFTVKEDGTIVVTGTKSSSADTRIWFDIAVNISFSDNVILNGCPSGGSNTKYKLTGFLGSAGQGDYDDIGSGVTIPANTTLNTITIGIAQQGNINLTFKPMIRLSSVSDATFAPYSNICPIIGWDEVNVTDCGINYFDKTTIQTGYVHDATGAISTGAGAKCTDFIRVLPNTSYYIKSEQTSGMWGAYYDENKNYVSGVTAYSNSVITTPSNAKYVRLTVLYNNSGNVDTFGINYPSTDTSYHAYNGATYTIDLNGTRYGGTLDATNGVLTVTNMEFDMGEVDYTKNDSFPNIFNYSFPSNYMTKNTSNAISEIYELYTSVDIADHDYGFAISNGRLIMFFKNKDYTDPSDFKSAMSGKKVVYELATPITVQLAPTPVKSLEGENNINANCGQITEVKYVVSKYNGMTAKISEFADKANQLTTDAGSNLNPVYFNNGVPVASIGNSIPFVVGTGTTAGTWLGTVEGLTAYYDGLLILYKPSVAGASTTTLNLNNLGAKTCYANGSTKLTTHYPANQPILLTYSASTNSGCFVAIDNYWGSNTIGEYAGACKAGVNGMARYSLIMQTKQSGNDETWESLVTTSSTSTSKTKNSSGFIVGSPVLYQSASTYAKDGVAGTSGCWSTAYNVDTRYSCNVSSSWSAEGRPFFIKGTINTLDGLFYLADTTWWADAYPTTADGFYYIYVGQMCDAYRLSLYPENPIFYYDGGLKVFIPGVAEKADAEDVVGNIFVDSTMDISVTPGTNAPKNVSLSVPGLVNKADKSTTLSGYNIGDAYISNGSITLGNNSITPLTSTSTLNAAKLSGTIPSSCYTDTNDAVLQSPISTNNNFEVLFSHSANNTTETSSVGKDNGFLYNPSTGAVTIGNRASGTVGSRSFAQGESLRASGQYSHAEGVSTTASGGMSHAEGYITIASGGQSHAEGMNTTASGSRSHAEGYYTTASGDQSHAEGYNTTANHKSQHVFGEYNISDPSTNVSTSRGTYVEIVGNGTSSANSNARTLDWSGNQWIAGNYSDTNGLLAMKEVTQAQYDALTTDEKNNGTAYFITDRLSPAATDLWTKVGTGTLNTTAQDCSAAINELNKGINDLRYNDMILSLTSISTMTTATSCDLRDKISRFRYLLIEVRLYNNLINTLYVYRPYFEGTSSGSRPLMYIYNGSGYVGTIEVYYNTDTKVYIKVSSGFNTNYKVGIRGLQVTP